MRDYAYRHTLFQRRLAFDVVGRMIITILGRRYPTFQYVVGIALHCADEAADAVVYVEAALAAVGEAVEESSEVGSLGFVVLDDVVALEVSELLFRNTWFFPYPNNAFWINLPQYLPQRLASSQIGTDIKEYFALRIIIANSPISTIIFCCCIILSTAFLLIIIE